MTDSKPLEDRDKKEQEEWYERTRYQLLLFAGGIALFVIVGALVLDWYVDPQTSAQKKDLVQALGLITAGVAGAVGIFFTWRGQRLTKEAQEKNLETTQAQLINAQEDLRLTRQGQITERFTRAIEQLGATNDKGEKKLEIRLGGIYALERIDKESPGRAYHATVMEVLTAYVRENSRWESKEAPTPTSTSSDVSEQDQDGIEQAAEPTLWSSLPTDVRAILDVLKRREENLVPEQHRVILDLRETDLRGADLRGTNLRQANLRGANLRQADLYGADLQEATLIHAYAEGADIRGANLERADLSGTYLGGANLQEAHLEGATLNGAHLEGASLNGAHLEKADLWGTHLEEANLNRAHLGKVHLNKAYLRRADLNRVRLEGANLHEAHLEGATLNGAHLEGAYLYGAHLEGASLNGAHLERASLNGAYLERADLRRAHLEGAHLHEAHLWKADLYGAHLEGASLREARLEGANLWEARLEGANLRNVRLEGAKLYGTHLEGALNLTSKQVEWTFGNEKTEIPEDLNRPELWRTSIEEQKKILREHIGGG